MYGLPESIYSKLHGWTNYLLSQGAMPVMSANDVLLALGFDILSPQLKRTDISDDEK